MSSRFGPAAAEAIAAACSRVAQRYAQLFGELAPPGAVEPALDGRSGFEVTGGVWVLTWPDREGSESDRTRWMKTAEEILPHEIGHVLLQAATGLPLMKEAHYGTALPDWFEEAVAVWMEPAQEQGARVVRLSGSADHVSLFDLSGASHPTTHEQTNEAVVREILESPCRGVCGDPDLESGNYVLKRASRDRDGSVSWTRQVLTPAQARARKRAGLFYEQSYFALDIIWRHGGPRAAAALRDRLASGIAAHRALLDLPGMPRDSIGLEVLWRQELEAQRSRARRD